MQTITTSDLAGLYTTGTDATAELGTSGITALWRAMVAIQYAALVEQVGVNVRFVADWPFSGGDSIGQLFAAMDAGDLPISTAFNESELNGEQGNLLFRAAHDLSHYLCDIEHRDEGVRCNFALDGETRAAYRQAKHMLALLPFNEDKALGGEHRTRLVQIIFSEVILQAAVFYESGDFAAQQVVLVPVPVINAWFEQNGLTALAV